MKRINRGLVLLILLLIVGVAHALWTQQHMQEEADALKPMVQTIFSDLNESAEKGAGSLQDAETVQALARDVVMHIDAWYEKSEEKLAPQIDALKEALQSLGNKPWKALKLDEGADSVEIKSTRNGFKVYRVHFYQGDMERYADLYFAPVDDQYRLIGTTLWQMLSNDEQW